MLLQSLSDSEVLSRIRHLTGHERKLTLEVLLHLNEIERRRLHLKRAFRSMFHYCTRELGYSESAAGRRIQTARCVARFPEVYALLASNQVNLTTISLVARVLTRDNKDVVLKRIRGMSQREVKALVAEYEPRASLPRDQVLPIAVRKPVTPVSATLPALDTAAAPGNAPSQVPAPARACESDNYSRSGSASDAPAPPASPEPVSGAAQVEKHYVVRFTAGEAFMEKLEQVRSLVWHRLPANASLEQVFELVMDMAIEREDPVARRERRELRAGRSHDRKPPKAATTGRHPGESTRHVPAAVRDRVFVRDQGRCTYTAPGGRRCASTKALQIDHIKPVARGGAGTPENLRLLCAYHNRLEAERLRGPHAPRGGP